MGEDGANYELEKCRLKVSRYTNHDVAPFLFHGVRLEQGIPARSLVKINGLNGYPGNHDTFY